MNKDIDRGFLKIYNVMEEIKLKKKWLRRKKRKADVNNLIIG